MKIFLTNYPETTGALIFSENQDGETKSLGKTVGFAPLTKASEAIRTLLSAPA